MMPGAGKPASGGSASKASVPASGASAVAGPRRAKLAEPGNQRARLLASVEAVVFERGLAGLTVKHVCAHAGISKRTFYELFTDVHDGLGATVEAAHERLWAEIHRCVCTVPAADWPAAVSLAIVAFLATVEARPATGWLCVVEPALGLPRSRAARQKLRSRLADLIIDGRTAEGRAVDKVSKGAAVGSVGALWELALQHLDERRPGAKLEDLAGSAILVVLSPHLDRAEATRLAAHPPTVSVPTAAPTTSAPPVHRLTELGHRTLCFLYERPAASNTEIATAIGITHASQVSRHLRWLEQERLVVGRREGRRNAWSLTQHGVETVLALVPAEGDGDVQSCPLNGQR